MAKAQYLIAKYVPDVFRNEPINIGVIVWFDGFTRARFLATNRDGNVNGQALPRSLIRSLTTYKQWVRYWVEAISEQEIKKIGGKDFAKRSDPKFLEILKSTGKSNYVLEQGGELLEDIATDGLDELTDFLYQRLVVSSKVKPEGSSAVEIRNSLLSEAKVQSSPFIKLDEPVSVPLDGTTIKHEFHLYIGNGKPDWLAQVILVSRQRDAKSRADVAAHRFEKVISANKISKDRCFALVAFGDEQSELIENETHLHDALAELKSVANVMDVRHSRPQVIKSIQDWEKEVREAHN